MTDIDPAVILMINNAIVIRFIKDRITYNPEVIVYYVKFFDILC